MIGWLLGKLGLGSATQAVEGVAGIIAQHMRDSESADELKARLRENADEVYAGVRKAMSLSRNLFVADATVLVLWVVGIALALYLIPRYGLATYDWIASYVATGELDDYPVGHHELISSGRAHGRLRRAACRRAGGRQAAREEMMPRRPLTATSDYRGQVVRLEQGPTPGSAEGTRLWLSRSMSATPSRTTPIGCGNLWSR